MIPTNPTVVPQLKPIKRWTAAKKAALLDMILSYKIEVAKVLEFYPDLTTEELVSWRELYLLYGNAGLRSTRQQNYRRQPFLLKKAA